ncbi:glycosyltransferase [Piscinibacter sp.]|uniref:glycosyltransferase n=1 Tax=Piscinibacter sp. TaxID=1903157 RepID=UPI002C790DFA|nr:glycosyltransferase [Albitalea sp.]HUG24776.1 glycosyltransferase [Albitalea sp.]
MPHLIVFSHLRWNSACQRPQHLLSRLAPHFPVLFVEAPVHEAGAARLERAVPVAGVEVLRPIIPVGTDGFGERQLALLQPLLADYLQERGIDDYAAWFYTPMAAPLLAGLSPRAVVYDCIDDLSAFGDTREQAARHEAALLGIADLVLAASPSLFEAKRELNPHVMCLPSAVEAHRYAPERAADNIDAMLKAEQVQGRIPGPRLGFFGTIDEQVDTALLAAVADAEPDWQIVMVGPCANADAARLPRRRNIHWLGEQPDALLPRLVADWDVCLLPFALNRSTGFVSPVKALEYMAAEKPVVGTAVHDIVAMYGDVVRIGHDTRSFIECCRWALSETAYKRAERVGEMLATVSRFSWDRTTLSIHEALADVLAKRPRRAQREAADTAGGRRELTPPRTAPSRPVPALGPVVLADG